MIKKSKYESHHQLQSLQIKKQNCAKSSFFDDANPLMPTFWTQIMGSSLIEQFQQKDIEGYIYRLSSKGPFKERLIVISQDKLVCYDNNEQPRKYTNLNNATLERIKQQDCNDEKRFGFKLTRNMRQVEFYTKDEQTNDIWIGLLKKSCIQRGFQSSYNVTKLLGRGSQAKVYGVTKKSNNKTYAVKAFDKSTFTKLDKPALINELSIMRKMDFKHIIHLEEVFENEQHVYLVCELLEGGEFFKSLSITQFLNEEIVAQIMFNILSATNYVHSHNIMHRDIKPENLMLKSKDITDICLADFGLADYVNKEGIYLFQRCGSPGYVAPEILLQTEYDSKVDLFSVGVIMFIILTGISPFQQNTTEKVLSSNEQCDIDFNTNDLQYKITTSGLSLLQSLLNKNPNLRPTAAQALQHPWFNQISPTSTRNIPTNNFLYPQSLPQDNTTLYSKTPLMNQALSTQNQFTPIMTPSKSELLSPKNLKNEEQMIEEVSEYQIDASCCEPTIHSIKVVTKINNLQY